MVSKHQLINKCSYHMFWESYILGFISSQWNVQYNSNNDIYDNLTLQHFNVEYANMLSFKTMNIDISWYDTIVLQWPIHCMALVWLNTGLGQKGNVQIICLKTLELQVPPCNCWLISKTYPFAGLRQMFVQWLIIRQSKMTIVQMIPPNHCIYFGTGNVIVEDSQYGCPKW